MNQIVKLHQGEDLLGFFYFGYQAAEAIVTLAKPGEYQVKTFRIREGAEKLYKVETIRFVEKKGLEEVETITYPR